MKTRNWLYWSSLAIAGVTVLSGLAQLIMPKGLLRGLSAENTPTSRHFFGIIGMFMVIVGGALLQALLSPSNNRILILWAALQKFGASVAVTIGVKRAVFSPLALLVASFDFFSGLLVMWYWVRTPARPEANFVVGGLAADTLQPLHALSGGKA